MSKRVSALRDKNGEWVKNLVITEELWKRSIQETLNGIMKLLESAEKLLQSGGNEAISAGLYTYAVEEYGKLLLLKSYVPSAGKVQVKYRNEFLNHPKKFETAISNLPKECKILSRELSFPVTFPAKFTKSVTADLEARFAVFYCDFEDSGDSIKSIPPVEKTLLMNAIDKFRTHVLNGIHNT